MRTNLIRFLCCLTSLMLLVNAAPRSADACHRCPHGSTCRATATIGAPVPTSEIRVQVDAQVVGTPKWPATPTRCATLVLNCPAESRCTIDGRVTHASGSSRQYHVTFGTESHSCRIELRLRDNDEEATYEFDHPLEFKAGQRTVLTVTQNQMTKTYDKVRSRVVADLFEPGTTFRVTADKKLEIVNTFAKAQIDSEERSASSAAAKIARMSPLWRTRAHQVKVLSNEIDTEKGLAKQAAEKGARREAAVQIHKRANDAHQVKLVEEDVAANGSASVRAARRLESKHHEIEVARARDVAAQAKAEFDAAKHDHQEALNRVSGLKRALELTEQKIIVEHLHTGLLQEQREHQRLRNLVQQLDQQRGDAVNIWKKLAANPAIASNSEVVLAREFEQRAQQHLTEAEQQFEQAAARIQQKEKEIEGFLNGTIHVDLP